MSVHATNTFKTNPGQAGELVETLSRVLPKTLTHGGCEEIRIWCDQDDPDSVVSLTRWANRADYEAYLAWREGPGTPPCSARCSSSPWRSTTTTRCS